MLLLGLVLLVLLLLLLLLLLLGNSARGRSWWMGKDMAAHDDYRQQAAHCQHHMLCSQLPPSLSFGFGIIYFSHAEAAASQWQASQRCLRSELALAGRRQELDRRSSASLFKIDDSRSLLNLTVLSDRGLLPLQRSSAPRNWRS